MKRSLVFLLVVFFVGSGVFATDYKNQLLFFTGIGTGMNGSDSNRLSIQAQIDFVKTLKPGGNKVIIGHSQGGVRALGFASTYPSNTAAVITIGSPVRGHPLATNPRTSIEKINNACTTIKNGVLAVAPVIGTFLDAAILQGQPASDYLFNILKLKSGNDPNLRAIAEMGLNPATGQYPGITDLGADSAFMNARINPGVSNNFRLVTVIVGQRTVLQCVGYQTVRFLWFTWQAPVYRLVNQPIYASYQVLESQTALPKIPNHVYLSFIRGTNNDVLSFFNAQDQATARSAIKTASDVMATAAGIEYALAAASTAAGVSLCATGWGIPAGIAAFAGAAVMTTYAVQATAGSVWLTNYKANIGDILGDRSNDSFIPYSAQSRGIGQGLGQIGGVRLLQETRDFDDNHETETTDPRIWGTGGSLNAANVTSDGYLARLLDELPQSVGLKGDGNYQGQKGHE